MSEGWLLIAYIVLALATAWLIKRTNPTVKWYELVLVCLLWPLSWLIIAKMVAGIVWRGLREEQS